MTIEALQSQFGKSWRQWKEEFSCNRDGCSGSTRVWKRVSDGLRGIQIHGMRFCFPTCFERELRIRLEGLSARSHTTTHGTRRIPLGLLMLSRGDLSSAQLQAALEAQRRTGDGTIGDWIQKLGFADEQQVTAALAAQWSCPVLWRFPESLTDCTVPLVLLRHFRMALVHYAPSRKIAHLAFSGPINYRALLAIEQVLDCRAEACMTSASALSSALRRMDGECRPSGHVFDRVGDPAEVTRIVTGYAAKLHATEVRFAACGEYVWIRIEGTNPTNLVFAAAQPRISAVRPLHRATVLAHL